MALLSRLRRAAPPQTMASSVPVLPLAPVRQLLPHQKLRDTSGTVYEVACRGSGADAFFSASDVGAALGLDDPACDYVLNSEFLEPGSDYVIMQGDPPRSLWLTYEGLMRVMFDSTAPVAEEFKDNVTKILCAAHTGTPAQRAALADQMVAGKPWPAV